MFAEVNEPVKREKMMKQEKGRMAGVKSLSGAIDARISSTHGKMLRVWVV